MSNVATLPPATAISETAARLSIAAAIGYQLLLIALIFIRPDIDPSWHTISEWELGPFGWIMSLAFIVSAAGYGLLFMAIKSQVKGAGGRTGLWMLFICFIGTVGVGLFTTDPYPPELTLSTTGILHTISGGLAMLLLPFAALLINLNLARKNPSWAPARRTLLWTAGLPLLALVSFIVHLSIYVMPMGAYYGPGLQIGWPPRILFLTYSVWVVILAWQAIRVRRHGPRAG